MADLHILFLYIRDVFISIMNVILSYPIYATVGVLFILDFFLSRKKEDEKK